MATRGSTRRDRKPQRFLDWIPVGTIRDQVLSVSQLPEVEEARQALLRSRDRGIPAGAFAIIFSSLGLLLYEVRRPGINIVTAFSIILCLLSVIGLCGVLAINIRFMAIDIVVGAALSMAICFSCLIQTFFEVEEHAPVGLSVMIAVLIVLFFVVFVCKLFVTHVVYSKLRLNRLIQECQSSEEELSEGEIMEQAQAMQGQAVCAVCTDVAATHAFVPCGHKIVCARCAERLPAHNIRTCPLCRRPYSQIIQVYGNS